VLVGEGGVALVGADGHTALARRDSRRWALASEQRGHSHALALGVDTLSSRR
jgi:hypothetical protein